MIENILEDYSDGKAIEMIAEGNGLDIEQILSVLIDYKEASRFKKTFNDDFKKLIAQRDINGVSRSEISRELQISAVTVKKSCTEFGQAVKEKSTSENEYTRMDGEFELSNCPSCGSAKNNLVDELNTTYCMECNSEHEYYEGYVMKVNFEYID